MPYIGRSLGDGVRARYIYAATSGQTTFSGNDGNGIALAYSDTLYMDVYQNGVLLKPVTDYASTTGTSVVLVTGASTDDVVEMIVYDSFAVADTVSAANGGTFSGNMAMGGTLNVTGAITSSAGATITTADNTSQLTLTSTDADASAGPRLDLKRDSGSPADNDTVGRFRFLFDNDAAEETEAVRIDAFIPDVSDGTEDATFQTLTMVGGTMRSRVEHSSTETVFNQDSVDIDFRVESDGYAQAIFVDAGNNAVCVGATALPTGGGSGITGAGFDLTNGGELRLSATSTGNHTRIRFLNPNGEIGTIRTNGSATAFNTSSDYRLKENVSYSWDATTRLKQLKPARFNFISDETNTLVDGFLAHEVQPIVPEAISGAKDAVDNDGNIEPQGIDHSKLVPLLVKTIQELEARITALEAG